MSCNRCGIDHAARRIIKLAAALAAAQKGS
jgi:hypothetical protein